MVLSQINREFLISCLRQKQFGIPLFSSSKSECSEKAGKHLQALNDKNLDDAILSLSSSAISKSSNSITSLCIADSFTGEDTENKNLNSTHLHQQSSSDEEEERNNAESLHIPIVACEEDDLEDVELGILNNLSIDQAHLKVTIPDSVPRVNTLEHTPGTERSQRLPRCCPICMEEFKDGDDISWSYNEECPHMYHVDCIVQWLMTDRCADGGDLCPMCRSSYLVDDPVLPHLPCNKNDGQELRNSTHQASSEVEVE